MRMEVRDFLRYRRARCVAVDALECCDIRDAGFCDSGVQGLLLGVRLARLYHRGGYCGFIPVLRITLPHFTCSAWMYAAKSSGDLLGRGSAPPEMNRCDTAGSASACTVAACSFATTSRGVPAGAAMPNHCTAS